LPKITDTTLQLWSLVLQRLPTARLLLKSLSLDDAATQRRLRQRLTAHGIAPDRVDLFGYIDSEQDHMDFYHRLDIALDTFPYHGTTTTCQSLWMGVPVITLAGPAHMSRVGVSLLSAAGLSHLIAQSPDEYADIAATLANDPTTLSDLRRTLRQKLLASPIMDAAGFTRNLESAYRQMWRQWCASGNA
jgi:predicted O-linked N-acetylglucosamine transferase (SPINDLY family)